MVHVLVMEDDANVLKFLERGLTFEGYEVTACTTGNEALIFAETKQVHLAVLD